VPKGYDPAKKYKEGSLQKLGGVLVSTNFSGDVVDVIVGLFPSTIPAISNPSVNVNEYW
jgi:hypothetical protein